MYYSTLYKEENMARGGINKTLIKEARQELLRKGINPSLDSIRVQLGNTGSKSTIHRYLKEIEEQEAVQLNDEGLLNNTLKEMISRLASQLNADANEIVEKNEEESSKKINQLNDDLNTFKKQLTHAETQIESLETKLLTVLVAINFPIRVFSRVPITAIDFKPVNNSLSPLQKRNAGGSSNSVS